MQIAVTGASGFLGRPLCEALVREGHTVVALGRNPERLRAQLPGTEPRRFDAQGPADPQLLRGCDAVVNLAGELIGQRWTPEVKRRIRDSRVLGTRAIAEAACAAGTVKTLINASAVGFYGHRGDEPLDEAAPAGDDFLARVCVEWEEATAPARGCGIRVALLRTGLIFHRDSVAMKKMLPLFRLGLGGPVGGGDQVTSWIHRDDVLALISHVLAHPSLEGPINAAAPGAVTSRELAQALGRAVRRPAFLPAPAFALRLAFGEMSEAVLTGQRVVPKRALESGFTFRYPGVDAALATVVR